MQHTHTGEEIEEITGLLTEILKDTYIQPDSSPVLNFKSKGEMVSRFYEATAPMEGMGLKQALELFRDEVLSTSVKTWHPLFLNQMFPGASFPSIVGDMLASMMNPTMATWEMSPAGTVIERTVAMWMANILGMKEGSSGVFLPGGSLSNLLALTIARNTRLATECARVGVGALPVRGAILCSDSCHYSVSNAANILGIGAENVIKVASNDRNEMLFEDFLARLDECDERGLKPFAVVATMGITVTGGFDPLAKLGPICRERNIHLHVDAAFGGGIALTKSGKECLAGIEYADSVIWDAHKWLHVPLATTALLVPDPMVLKAVFSSNADYIYHPQDDDVDLADDLGNYTILCGKRFEALRLWLLFKAFGEEHFRTMGERQMELTRGIAGIIAEHPDLSLSYEPRSPLVCFRYLPAEIANSDVDYLDRLHRKVREACKMEGRNLFNMARLKGRMHFRMVLVNPLTELHHLKEMLGDIERIAKAWIKDNPPS